MCSSDLSGDIGSGKSSILLAIEFALFGVRRKHLSGGALLRNGRNHGSVELKFEVDNREIVIKRFLKRGKDNVEQTAGYIVVDGIKQDATAVELKTKILELLGYPKELITKTKNLVYRYTVYTPQEEMKQILIEDEDERLDTLRKVFGIAKYKKIRENCMIAVRSLKEKKRDIEAAVSDLEEKKKQKLEKGNEIKILDEKISSIIPKLEIGRKQVQERKGMIMKLERNIEELYKLKKESEVREFSLQSKVNEGQRNNKNIEELQKQIEILKKDIQGKEVRELEKEITEKQEQIVFDERKLREIADKISELKAKKLHSSEIKDKIMNLDKCPTCEQNVSINYKGIISSREDGTMAKIDASMADYSSRVNAVDENVRKLKAELEMLRKQESEFSIILLKKRNIVEKEKTMNELFENNEKLKKEIEEINIIKQEISKKMDVFEGIDDQFKQLKLELESIERDSKRLEMEKVSYETEKKGIEKNILIIDAEILAKEDKKKKAIYLSELQNWIEEGFLNLMTVMEKHVMANVYSEFNDLFQKWFNLLMEDETITVRLDDRFTPLVDQNGYEIDISYLSGGERTAAALAYRLALNKVVNDLMSEIKTKDLIILDEPTDGFSSEQLDRVRDVLNEIGTKQTILVSHEQKIESFVDEVIRINKNEHVSEVV